ncbi:MAG: DNA-binding transcriptional repressor DeoR [Mixta calida]|uniref:DNA-binding transcriptional repressor DeoR n=2 Tax=Mixta calida TaxID=665913 RepID=A0ABM6RXV4_9GAMM|nr:DNA-binding transcriptional repressor DeoR [Mixta calida]AIX74923.1 transcriptional regulator [Pantoea sp. PSNIH2]MBS6059206.1 DNA-binding transcriptional repressor DeoR [Pantoea sp.]POU49026.1 DNA-binding transcriptional repressor DeoR [Pantoea sp. PSNIH5]POU70199.1 DNA-binding transcriptional repressor DeoR [Pantoea sp. PSNIH4]POY66443.1 DNA-binding transcriptional repressor DeoR [Pantoea sp. PSNIH3]
METRREERIGKLAQAIRRIDKIHLKEAARLLGVSEMTIRRDLNEQPSCLVLLGGYIVSAAKGGHEHYFVSDQQSHNVDKKQRLAKLAASLISPDDTVFFDCGTTMPWVIDAIDDALPFTAVCCAINTFLSLKEKKACRVILSGGEFHPDNAVFSPHGAVTILDEICPTLAFISAAGLDAQQGATCYNFNELPMKQRALARTQRALLLADSSKYNKVLPARIGDLGRFDTLISDSAPPEPLAQHLRQSGVTLLTP